MPNNSRSNREKSRKKTRYSSDSESEREVSRRYREKSKSSSNRRSRERSSRDTKSSKHKTSSSSRRKRYSSSSSSSSDTSRSSSSSSKKSRSSSEPSAKTSRASSKNFDHITKFEINDLYKEEDKGKILNNIEAESFKQETFQSKKKIIVDLKKDKIVAPESLAAANQEEESLIHPNFLGDEDVKVDKWIKKLQLYRSS